MSDFHTLLGDQGGGQNGDGRSDASMMAVPMIIDETTEGRSYPLPHTSNPLDVDVERIRSAFAAIDGDVAAIDADVAALIAVGLLSGHFHGALTVTGDLLVEGGRVRVGRGEQEQPVATREEAPADGAYARWDAAQHRFVTVAPMDVLSDVGAARADLGNVSNETFKQKAKDAKAGSGGQSPFRLSV